MSGENRYPRATPEPSPIAVDLRLYTISEWAKLAHISRSTAYKVLDSGDIGYVRLGTDRRISHAEIMAWIDRSTVKAENR